MTTGDKIMTSLALSAAFLTAIATMPAAHAQMGHQRGRGGDQWSAD
jgi:hypothetical protein